MSNEQKLLNELANSHYDAIKHKVHNKMNCGYCLLPSNIFAELTEVESLESK